MKAKPCPFCGGVGDLVDLETRSVICRKCDFGDGAPMSLDDWNKRPAEDKLCAVVQDVLRWATMPFPVDLPARPAIIPTTIVSLIRRHGLDPETFRA